jgi:hypothetical protein
MIHLNILLALVGWFIKLSQEHFHWLTLDVAWILPCHLSTFFYELGTHFLHLNNLMQFD